MYLDDGLSIEQDDELCKAVVNQVKCDLINSCFVPKVEKSLWKPTKRLIWLGTFSIVKQELSEDWQDCKYYKLDTNMLGNTYNFYARKVASFVGHANNTYVFSYW